MWRTELHPACEEELLRLKDQNNKLLSKVIFDLKLLREFGLNLLEQDRMKKLTPEIFELRTKQGTNINRVLFGVRGGEVAILVVSFVKKADKTPQSKVELAERRLAEWRGSHG